MTSSPCLAQIDFVAVDGADGYVLDHPSFEGDDIPCVDLDGDPTNCGAQLPSDAPDDDEYTFRAVDGAGRRGERSDPFSITGL